VNYYSYSQAGGPTNTGWAWLNNAGNPGWTVVGAADMNQDGVPDLIWINQSDSQHAIGAVTVNYYGGTGGAIYEGWAWLNQAGISGWNVGAVADMNSNGEPDLIWQDATSPDTVTAYYYSLAGVCDYTYDDLARLSAASCGSVWAQTFSYDAFGNISKSGSMSFGPTYSAATNQYTRIGPITPTYDNNGNLTWDNYHHYTWDGEGNLATLDGNGDTYDALNRRVEQYNGSAYTEIVYGPAGNKLALMNGQAVSKVFAQLSGGATAVYNSSGLQYYRHPDWLGSSRVASTPGRTVYYDGAYAPFGENYAETGTTDRNFTGQNQDMAPDLYDFRYREYHPVQGRWVSPDPAGLAAANPTNPQSWNRYAYVLNNPLSNTDLLGLVYCAPDDSGDPDTTQCVSDDDYNANPDAYPGWQELQVVQSVTVTDTNDYQNYQSVLWFVYQPQFEATLAGLVAGQLAGQTTGQVMVPTPKPKTNKPPVSLCLTNPEWAVGNPIYGPAEPSGSTAGSGNWAVYSPAGPNSQPRGGYQYGSTNGAPEVDGLALGLALFVTTAQCLAMAF
jgi:RHS repeat-associated protein